MCSWLKYLIFYSRFLTSLYSAMIDGVLQAIDVYSHTLSVEKVGDYTLQEMCCGFLLSREMWYRKSVLPGTGAG